LVQVQVTVRFSGLLRSLAGTRSLTLSLDDGATLQDLLRCLHDTLPAPFIEQVLTSLEIDGGPLALLLLNRKHLQGQERLDHTLQDGDVVAFVTPMAGGHGTSTP
jgi:molybdopterin converting factor small subunit